MDPTHHVIDPEGDIILSVEEYPGFQQHLSVFRADTKTPIQTPGTFMASEGPSSENVKAIAFAPDAPETLSNPSALLSHQHNNGVGVVKLRALVSSKHLTLGSKFFHAKLHAMLDLGEIDMLPSPYDTDALLILLRILHCRTRQVPRDVSLGMLHRVAILVDHYGCLDSVEVFSEVWIGNLMVDDPEYTDDVDEWVFIAWIFCRQELIKLTTEFAVRCNMWPMSEWSPSSIHHDLLRTVDKARQDSIEYILEALYRPIKYFMEHMPYFGQKPSTGHRCCYDCDQLIVGTLLRHLRINGLYPRPLAPFEECNVEGVLDCFETVPKPRCNALIHPVNGCQSKCVLLPETDPGFSDGLEAIKRVVMEMSRGDFLWNRTDLVIG